jgi:hypothetical protein
VNGRVWLEEHGLGQYAEAFASSDVDPEVLRTLTADDLKELGVASLGDRKKLLAAIVDLDAADKHAPASARESRMPRHLAERVLRSRAALEGERKQVTVLLADVKGSLALIEDTDPEDARRILDAAVGVMMDAVHRAELLRPRSRHGHQAAAARNRGADADRARHRGPPGAISPAPNTWPRTSRARSSTPSRVTATCPCSPRPRNSATCCAGSCARGLYDSGRRDWSDSR